MNSVMAAVPASRLLDEDHVPGTWDRHQAGARNDVLRLQRIVVSLVEPP